MTTLLIGHPASLDHDTGPGHPETSARVRTIEAALAAEAFAGLSRKQAPRGALAPILRVHPAAYLDALKAAMPAAGRGFLDGDTAVSPGTWEAALHAAGGAVEAVEAVMRGEADNAFVVTRPPGHHASRDVPMGFCLFNNAAIAARHAQAAHGAERIAIVDFDVHHGNGTQAIFWDDPSILYCSTHQMPLFPGTGAARETGAHGTIVNAPLFAGTDGDAFKEAFKTAVLPRLAAFAPDLIIISAGFDAHWRDPLANLNLTEADFAWVTNKLIEAAARCDGRIVSVLEGGYDLHALGQSAAAHVAALMGNAYSSTGS